MHTILAWFITFNFINISWIFFRAKNFDDALKVLNSMFFAPFMLPEKYIHKFHLDNFNIINNDAWLANIYADKYILLYLFLAAILLTFKNSMQLQKEFVSNIKTAILTAIILLIAFLNLRGVHEFLYFNF